MSHSHNQHCLGCNMCSPEMEKSLTNDLLKHKELHISLGTHCDVAGDLKNLGLRVASFPFDWILSFNHRGFIQCLRDKCSDFINPLYLIRSSSGTVINTKYMFDFRHDWKIGADTDWESIETKNIQDKYTRRISRFFDVLSEFKGAAHFYRKPFENRHSISGLDTFDVSAYDPIPNNVRDELITVLCELFPNLNFQVHTV